MNDPYESRMLQSVVNLMLATHGEPEPSESDSTTEIADKLDMIARRIRVQMAELGPMTQAKPPAN